MNAETPFLIERWGFVHMTQTRGWRSHLPQANLRQFSGQLCLDS